MNDEQFDAYTRLQRRNFWMLLAFTIVIAVSNGFVFYAVWTH